MEQYVFDKFKICIACFIYDQRKCTHQCDKNVMLVQFLRNVILSVEELCRLCVALIPISPAICI